MKLRIEQVDEAGNAVLDAGRYPTESTVREAQVSALTNLVAGVMASCASLKAQREVGFFSRILRRFAK